MNICFFLNGFTVSGGIGRVASVLAGGLSERTPHGIHALCLYDTGKPDIYPLDQRIRKADLFDGPLSMKAAMLHGGILRMRRYIKANKIDIVVACGALYFPMAVLACRGTAARCVCWEHGNLFTEEEHDFQRQCRRFGALHADWIVVLTRQDELNYRSAYGAARVRQIYNPIDDALFRHEPKYDAASNKIISAGRLTPPKNYEAMIDIARIVLPGAEGWTWDIFGDGELYDALLAEINDAGLQQRLFLRGRADDLYERYGQYAFLVMTSTREGFPMVLLEAAACGLPLVSFDIMTGPAEIIENGANGYLIKAFENKEMADRILELTGKPALRADMSAAARKGCAKFAAHTIIKEWTDLFETIERSRTGERPQGAR